MGLGSGLGLELGLGSGIPKDAANELAFSLDLANTPKAQSE